jgi:DNA-binding LacI/PurR family transcriptional regulator
VHNLLTGKKSNRAYPQPDTNSIAEEPWTAEAYLTAMRRLLAEAGETGNHTASYLAAAGVLAQAAMAVSRTPALARVPGDGDTVR